MTITINARAAMHLTISSTRDDIAGGGDNLQQRFADFDYDATLSSSTTPPVTKAYKETLTGTQTLDLTALVDDYFGTVDGSGLKLQAILVRNTDTADDLVMSKGAANGYELGSATATTIPPGGKLQATYNDKLDDIDATHKNLTFTPGAGKSYDVVILMG